MGRCFNLWVFPTNGEALATQLHPRESLRAETWGSIPLNCTRRMAHNLNQFLGERAHFFSMLFALSRLGVADGDTIVDRRRS